MQPCALQVQRSLAPCSGRDQHQPVPLTGRSSFSSALRPSGRQPRRPPRLLVLAEGVAAQQTSPSELPRVEEGPRRLVVAVDGTEDSISAFHWTLRNIYRPGDQVFVLHVMPDLFSEPASGSIYYCPSGDPETERCLWTQAREFIYDNFVEAGQAQGVSVEVVLVKEKHKGVGHALCRKAEELGASTLILQAHKKSKLEELLMGSTARYCVNNCARPVLLLH